MLPVLVYPCRYLAELIEPGFAKPVAPLLLNINEAAIGQDLDMQRYSLARNIKVCGYSVYIMRLCSNHVNYSPSGRVGYGLVNISSGFHLRKYLLANISASIYLRNIF
jgi:hypothetical protein